MRYVRVERSPLVQFLVGLVGLLLVLVALDVVWIHRFSSPPDRANGALTTRGRGDLAVDAVWGAALLLAGGGLFTYAVVGLVRRKAIVEVGDEGMTLDVGGPLSPGVFVPWDDVAEVRCGFVEEGIHVVPCLEIELRQRGALPARPWGATWADERTLVVEAEDWSESVEDVAIHASVALAGHQRDTGEAAGEAAC